MSTATIDTGVEDPAARFDRMSQTERLAFLRQVAKKYNLRAADLSTHTGYSVSSVEGWFSAVGSPRNRPIPSRALRILAAELAAGRIQTQR